ncbi:MAG TPA: glycosyltransferase [Candidatus Limnocylindria bacterium]|nr:glycosyltransferase [Candidatus Limnocylindria bacterium]
MSPRRLLLLCYFYPPLAGGGVHRVLSFTRHLPAHGWACTVVCAGEGDYWVTDETLDARVPAETEVIRVPGGSVLATWRRVFRGRGDRLPGESAAALRRWSDWWLLPDSYVGWAPRARAAAAKRIARGGVSAILSSSPPESVHLAALPLRRRFGIPWIADFRDPWVGLYRRTPPSAWHRRRQSQLERTVMSAADVVLSASRTQMDFSTAGSGARPRRVELIPNGFEPASDVATAESPDPAWFVIAFTGTLSQVPDTDVFLEAVHELLSRHPEARRRVRVRLAGPYDPSYADRAVALGLRGIVEFLGQRSQPEVRTLQRRADLLALWIPRGSGYRAALPGKLYEYLDAGRPVVALLEPQDEAVELVRRAGGTVVAPGARAALTDELERRYRAWSTNGREPDARPAWLDDFARERLAGRLARVLDQVCGART